VISNYFKNIYLKSYDMRYNCLLLFILFKRLSFRLSSYSKDFTVEERLYKK